MKLSSRSTTIKVIGVILCSMILILGFFFNSLQNLSHEDYRNSNFLKFWAAGHMILTGQNPYDPTRWYEEQLNLGATQVPDRIFLYPLPQAYFMIPLALLPITGSFIVWGIISQAIIAATCFILLNKFAKTEQIRLFLPLVVFLLFFGPIYLSLHIGSIGAMALVALLGAILLLERRKTFLAGMLFSILVLKPSQGLPILFLVGLWFLVKRDWKVIIGMTLGGMILFISGWLYDPLWVQKFLLNSQTVTGRTLGLQSNIFSYAYLYCNKEVDCTRIMGAVGILLVLGLGCVFLWFNRERLSIWEVVVIIIPIGFVSTIYIWSYDQLLYIFPILWISANLVKKTKSYLLTFIFLIILDTLSFIALVVQAKTQNDLLSGITTILVLTLSLWLFSTKKNIAIDKPIPSA
jgi:hypothetical protein